MNSEPIGILLSKSQWKEIIIEKNKNSYCFQYYYSAKKLGKNVVFFTLDHLSLKEDQVEAFQLKDDLLNEVSLIKIPQLIYNPNKYNKKKNIRKLRALVQSNRIKLINEHHLIKQKHLTEILESHKLNIILKNEIGQELPLYIIHVVCQKKNDLDWEIPFKYVKDIDGEKYTINEFPFSNQKSFFYYSEEYLNEISKRILKAIHFYFPGISELGLKLIVNGNGELLFESTCTISDVINDLTNWKPSVIKKITEYPFIIADSIYNMITINSNQLVEHEHKLQALDPAESGDRYWVRIKVTDETGIVRLSPKIFNTNLEKVASLKFGVIEEQCRIIVEGDIPSYRKSTYDEPFEISISKDLVENMHIPVDMVFQLFIMNDQVVIGPTIGFLLGDKNQTYNLKYMQKYKDRLEEYKSFGGLVIAFSPRSVNWNKKIAYGLVYDPLTKEWRYDSTPIPSVIYRRNFHQDEKLISKLREMTNNNLFNSHHFNKSDLHSMQNETIISKHIPSTYLLDEFNKLFEFLKSKEKIILKPVSLSRGRGIFILEKHDKDADVFNLFEYNFGSKVCHTLIGAKELYNKLSDLNILDRDYLYQTYIPLLKIQENPFDVRVVMQKYQKGNWKCSGIECRVAGENEDLTNIARGGQAMSLDEAITKSNLSIPFTTIHSRILKVCQNFCTLMDQKREHYAEFGLDIALDQEGHPWILEANIYPSFKGFKKMDYYTYLKIRFQPLYYAVNIQGFNVLDESFALTKVYNA